MLLITLLILFISFFPNFPSYKYYFNNNNPFPFEKEMNELNSMISSKIANYSSNDSNLVLIANNIIQSSMQQSNKTCVYDWLGDGNCNKENNNEFCAWDKGDCCAESCITNCKTSPCTHKCGSTNAYYCISGDKCAKCVHGKCQSMSNCLNNDDDVRKMINSCLYNSRGQGNLETIDNWCGKDTLKNTLHILSNKNFHFPGCGIESQNCTSRACCSDILENNIDASKCDSKITKLKIYDKSNANFTVISNSSCIDYFRECFLANLRVRGQCCVCDSEWTGYSCEIPLCLKPCIHGECVSPNKCKCFDGYSGTYCDKAICDLKGCVNGYCIAPNKCECFYGYYGANCTIPIRYPFCINGYAKTPYLCECYEGWQGNLCEISKSVSCNYGICRDDGNCDCGANYKSSSENSLCDTIISCEIKTPFCLTCNKIGECDKCQSGFYMSRDTSNNIICMSCSNFDTLCDECEMNQCLRCKYPYELINNICDSFGIIELSSKYYSTFETSQTLSLTINRLYGSEGVCQVSYEITPILQGDINEITDYLFNPLNKLEKKKGDLVFNRGETSKTLTLEVYPDDVVDTNTNSFYIKLYNSFGGCYLGDMITATIEVYEDTENLVDCNSVTADIDIVIEENGLYNIFYGRNFTLKAYSYKDQNRNKTDGKDNFFAIVFDKLTNSVEKITSFVYQYNNTYNTSIATNQLTIGKKIVEIYNSMKGFHLSFFLSSNLHGIPYFMNYPSSIKIPEIYSNMSFYSMQWRFLFTPPQLKTNYTFSFFIPNSDDLLFSINSMNLTIQSEVLVTEDNCFNNINCKLITFQQQSFIYTFSEFIIKYYHYQAPAFLFHKFSQSLTSGIVYQLDSTNSLSLTQISQDPFLVNIFVF